MSAAALIRRIPAWIAVLGCVTSPLGVAGARAPQTPTVTSAGFAIARAPYRFSFPRDDAAHPAYESEWWYFTGHLKTAAGRRFGYELTFFRVGMAPDDPPAQPWQSKWRGNELYPAHFALTDEAGGTFFHEQRIAREALGMGAASARRLDVRANDWFLRTEPPGNGKRDALAMHARADTVDGANAIDLVQESQKPPAVHGRAGVSRKAACFSCASHYYSYTRLRTRGTLEFHGQRLAVDGISWMDHEFGSGELQPDQAGWDWFALQLDDGRELMLYRLRQKDGKVTPQSSGSLIERDGRVRYLPLDAFTIETMSRWKSPHTGGDYPSAWRIRVPAAGVDVSVTPTVADQELPDTSGGVSYWEGSVDLHGTAGHLGVGYVELTGYAGAVSL